MKMKLLGLALFSTSALMAQQRDAEIPDLTSIYDVKVKVVESPVTGQPPSDATILFDGANFDAWEHLDGSRVKWKLVDGAMQVVGGSGNIRTKQKFEDVQLHIEFATPSEVKGNGQGRGNSGIFFQSRYEIQVLDNYQNETYANGQVGSIYKQHIPLANPSRKPGEWQTYDIIYTAPTYNEDGLIKTPARITALLNGVLVQNNVSLLGTTEYIGIPKLTVHGADAIMLQDHGNPTRFRNIWVRPL
ncbi:MAG: 3-keto-disaccharide hydrolase [Saprospiraceae bacterium]